MDKKRKKRKQQSKKSKPIIRAKSQQEMVNDNFSSSIQVTDVNSDCLEYVFYYLNLMDLINVADANKKFRQVAVSVFGRKYKEKKKLIIDDPIDLQIYSNDTTFITDNWSFAFKILRLFGEFFTKIDFFWLKNYDTVSLRTQKMRVRLLGYVNKFCSKTLESIALLNGPPLKFAENKKPYKNVEVVSIMWGRVELKLSQLKDTFPKMRKLILKDIEFPYHKDFATNFNQLEHLSIHFSSVKRPNIITKANIIDIIDLNPQLQGVDIEWIIDMELLNYISKKLVQLKFLGIEYVQDEVQSNAAGPILFERIEKFKLYVRSGLETMLTPELFFSFNKLKECTIFGDINKSCINFVTNNPTIEKLSIISTCLTLFFGEQDMEKIATNLLKLVELHMTKCLCSVSSVNSFLNQNQSIRKISIRVVKNDEEKLNELHSSIKSGWNITKSIDHLQFRLIEIEKI